MRQLAFLALCLVCAPIVPVFQVRLAAAVASSSEIPVQGGTAAFAGALGIDPVPDRGRFVSEIMRLVYDNETRNPTAAAFLTALRTSQARGGKIAPPPVLNKGTSELVPLPLTAEIWSNAVFRRKVAPEDLFVTILADRQAALLCHGLAALDDETLQFFAEHTSLLSRLYERHAPTFSVFSSGLHVRANRLVPDGDQTAVPLWEAVVGEKMTRPDRFVQTMFELNEGRLAYLYDIAGHIEAPHRAFVLGLWIKDATARLERFKQLATVGVSAFREWHVRTMPYGRSTNDLATVLTRVDVAQDGTPAPPDRGWWTRVFASADLTAEAVVTKAGDDQPIDAAWLAEVVGGADVRQRGERLDQMAFGQRVFGGKAWAAADTSAVFVALRALPQYRTLMLTLERIGVRTPAIYAAAARHASRLTPLDGRRGFLVQAQFQGAIALIARMAQVRTIDARTAASAIERLVSAPVNESGRYGGAIARWLQDDEDSILPPGNDVESALLAALGGAPSADPSTPVTITWEGQEYRFDLGFAERTRLTRVRQKQEGPPIDVSLEIAGLARRVTGDSVSLPDVEAVAARLTKIEAAFPQWPRHETLATMPAGVGPPADIHELLRKAIEVVAAAVKNREPKRASRAAEPLAEAADELLAQALLSFSYAMYVGDPDGNVLLAGDVSYRHDFGFGMKDGALRARGAWSVPRQDVAPGVPWHLAGSLLGLDIGLAPLALRRLNFDHLMHAPKLTSNERDAFATSVALMNPYALRDADRDAIAEAVVRGRARVLEVTKNPAGFDEVAGAIAMDGARRRALRWTLDRDASRLPAMFSLAELMFLGGIQGADVNAWGMSALGTMGCFCTRLGLPRWWALTGRPQLGIVAAGMPDLTLHIAARLKELQMPAALTRVVLSAAMQDFIDEVQPTDDSDWLTLTRAAQAATREQVEDYLASATADGPLVPVARRPQ